MESVFILGSCVTRDAFDLPTANRFKLTGYLARTSLASQVLAGADVQMPHVESAFERRMLEADAQKTVFAEISDAAFDVLVLDFIDDRFDIALHGMSGFLVSDDHRMAGTDKGKVLPAGSFERMNLWRAGMRQLLRTVRAKPRLPRVVVNAVYWAEYDCDGHCLANVAGDIKAANHQLARIYRECAEFGVEVLHYRSEFVADPAHRWGLAPFHYLPEVYEEFLHNLWVHGVRQ